MKKCLLIIAVISAVISCSSVRELVLESEVNGGEIKTLFTWFTKCHYTPPQSKEELVEFLRQYNIAQPDELSTYDENGNFVSGEEFVSLFEKEQIMVEAYKDSAFFYFPDRKPTFGFSVYSPYYWLLHPEKYGNMDYYTIFGKSALKKNGDFYFGFNYKLLDSVVNAIPNSYKIVILTRGYDNRFNLGDGGIPVLEPMRIIATYDVAKDSLYRTSEFPVQSDSVSFSNVLIQTDPDIPSDIYVTFDEDNVKRNLVSRINLDSLSKELLKSIAPKIRGVAQKDTLTGKIIFPVYLYCNIEL